jgi:periplasmic protein TonB
MLLRALLMCTDAKAIEAVSQVLAELEINFETVADPAVAAKQLANQRFDPILVDCDNVPDATLVLESGRTSSANQSSMTIAIVDGKAGVPTAFRLGARLVMTKPVSLEGARSTLRNALAMQRKEVHDSKVPVAAARGADATPTQMEDASVGQTAVSEAQEARVVQPSSPPAQLAGADSATALPSATAKVSAVPAVPSAPFKGRSSKELTLGAPLTLSRPKPASTEADDATASQPVERPRSRGSSTPPSFSTLDGPGRKTSPYLLAGVFMILAAAAFYTAFMMLPSFHNIVLSQYEGLRDLITATPAKRQVGLALSTPTAVSAQPVTLQAVVPASAQPLNEATGSAPLSTAPSSSGNAVADGFAPAPAAPTSGFKKDTTKTTSAPAVLLPTSAAAHKGDNDNGPVVLAEDLADAHVSYRVQPVYPYAARRKGVEGAVVLQVSVNTDGSVGSVRVLSGNTQLAPSAVEAVKQWRYEPYYASGQPVVFQTQVTVRFQASSH